MSDPAPKGRSRAGWFLAGADRLSAWSARACAVFLAAITAMLFYEVIARYFFHASTAWSQDLSIAVQIWLTYLGMAWVLRKRELIRITAIVEHLGPLGRRCVEGLSLLAILAFSLLVIVQGVGVVEESLVIGRRQPTILQLPTWITEIPIIIGFAFLAIQAVADLIRLPHRPPPAFAPTGEHGEEETLTS